MRLSTRQVNAFRDQGVLIAPGIVTEEDFRPVVDEINAFIDRRARELQAQGKLRDLHADAPFDTRIARLYEQCAEIVSGIDIMRMRGRALFEFLHNKNLLDAVECLIGSELTCSPIQHLRPKVPTHMGAGNYEMVPWHQDAAVTLEDADASDIVTCWMPMVDATQETGCMEVLPGAWKQGLLEHVNLGGTTIRPDLLPKTPPLCAECPRGGVVFMSKLTPHRGLPNRSEKVRWTIDLRFQKTGTPTGRPFHPEFPVRSLRDPGLVRKDYDDWCRRWEACLSESKGKRMHRVAPVGAAY